MMRRAAQTMLVAFFVALRHRRARRPHVRPHRAHVPRLRAPRRAARAPKTRMLVATAGQSSRWRKTIKRKTNRNGNSGGTREIAADPSIFNQSRNRATHWLANAFSPDTTGVEGLVRRRGARAASSLGKHAAPPPAAQPTAERSGRGETRRAHRAPRVPTPPRETSALAVARAVDVGARGGATRQRRSVRLSYCDNRVMIFYPAGRAVLERVVRAADKAAVVRQQDVLPFTAW